MSQLRTSSVSHKDATNDNIKLKVDGSSIAGRETVAEDESLTLATKGYVDANGGGGGGASVSVGEAPPSGASEGDLWWDSSEGATSNGGRMYVYYNGQWVQSSNVGGDAEGGDGGTSEIYGTAKAWGFVASDGTLIAGKGATTSKDGSVWQITFDTPRKDTNYTILLSSPIGGASVDAASPRAVNSADNQTTGFKVVRFNSSTGNNANGDFYFAVFDNEPVTVSGGGGGGDSSGSGADAWANVAADGTLDAGFNVASVNNSAPGYYELTWQTPMPSGDYSVVISTTERQNLAYGQVVTQDSTGCQIRTAAQDTTDVNIGFNVAVFASNAIAPQSGVGADAWANVAANGTINAGFNIASVVPENVEGASQTGYYEATFVTPMPNTRYAINLQARSSLATSAAEALTATVREQTTTGFKYTITNNSSRENANHSITVFASSTVTPTYTWTRNGTTLLPANAGDDVVIGGTAASPNIKFRSSDHSMLLMGDGTNGNLNVGDFTWNNGDNYKWFHVSQDGSTILSSITEGGAITTAGIITCGSDAATWSDVYTGGTMATNGVVARQPIYNDNAPIWACINVQRKNGDITARINADGSASFTNTVFNLNPSNSANYNSSGEYTGATLDVKDKLQKADAALTAIKTAATDSNTDLAGLKSAIVSALTNF